MKELASYCNYF